MGLTTINNDRTILITGKTGTGKSTKAKTFVNDPIILYANDIDFDIGIVTGYKLNRNFGIFGEGRYLSYWGIDSYEIKAGINYTIF